MKRHNSPGVIYVGRLLFAAQSLVGDLTDRAGAAERGIHRVARSAVCGRDCRDAHGPQRVEELRIAIAELTSQLDGLVSGAPQGDLGRLS